MKSWIFLMLPCMVSCNITLIGNSLEDRRIYLLVDLIVFNLKDNGWNNIITLGHFPDSFYNKIKELPFTSITYNGDKGDLYVDDVVPYHSNIILIDCSNFNNFEQNLRKIMRSPYWYPPSNFIILYKQARKQEMVKIFYILWFYRIRNAILIQHDDTKNVMYISEFNPFVVGVTMNIFGCRTFRPVGMPINNYTTSFVCEDNCENVTANSKNRHLRLGTCMELKTHTIPYDDRTELTKLNLFEDKGKNMNGFALRALTTETIPFLIIKDFGNGTFEFGSRDGQIWNHLSKLMNFTLDLTPSLDGLKNFNFEHNTRHVFSMAQRKGDLLLMPIYQFDVIVVELDNSFPYKDSGVCFLSHRAPFETVLFDLNTLRDNIEILIKFSVCLLCIWLVFLIYSALEADKITADLFGKNFMNMIRSSLSITLYNPPKKGSFRIFLTIILWSFFVLSFSSQAAIISFFTAYKRGQEVETYADIAKTGYRIQGVPSPDAVLPDDDEIFRQINSKLQPIDYMYSCLEDIADDPHRFCLLDCAVARYMRLNLLNSKGEQYLHVANDRVHSYYLNFVFQKYSFMTETVNKYLMIFFEAGLIRKWEEFRFNDLKEEAQVKPIGIKDFQGVLKVYLGAVLLTFLIFLLEVFIGNMKMIEQRLTLKMKKWKRTRATRKIERLERKENKITITSSSTQT